MNSLVFFFFSFFFNDTATTEIYTLSLHDALPISERRQLGRGTESLDRCPTTFGGHRQTLLGIDRKSTRLNSSHTVISYAVFCLKKKKKKKKQKIQKKKQQHETSLRKISNARDNTQ